jgi:TonB-dependent Receptor Plug Domain
MKLATNARFIFLTLIAVLALACSSAVRTPRGSVDSRVITEDEIDATRATNAYEAIQKLRANFLTYRGETSLDKSKSRPYPTVYLDGQEYGPIETLRNIPVSHISEIRLYRASEANLKFGSSNMGGVISILTRQ